VIRKLPLTNEEFKSIYSKVTRLCVDLIINDKRGILLTLRQKNGWQGQWHFPGGTVCYREAVKDAVKRIAKEELGTSVKIVKLAGYIEYLDEVKERGFGYSVSIAFICHLKSEVMELDDQVEKAEFFKDLPKNMIIIQKDFLNKIIKEKLI
jgi:ADP-ribose pyrophosphatase YjhB (NUDIX family)